MLNVRNIVRMFRISVMAANKSVLLLGGAGVVELDGRGRRVVVIRERFYCLLYPTIRHLCRGAKPRGVIILKFIQTAWGENFSLEAPEPRERGAFFTLDRCSGTVGGVWACCLKGLAHLQSACYSRGLYLAASSDDRAGRFRLYPFNYTQDGCASWEREESLGPLSVATAIAFGVLYCHVGPIINGNGD